MLGNIRALPRWGREGGGGRAEKFLLHDGCNNTMSCGRDLGFSSDRVGGRKKRTRHGGKETRETEDGLRCLAMHHLCLPLRPYARFTYTPFWWARTMRLTPQAYLGNKRARHDTKLARPPRPGICVPRHNVTAAMRSRPLSLMMMRHLRDKTTRRGEGGCVLSHWPVIFCLLGLARHQATTDPWPARPFPLGETGGPNEAICPPQRLAC